MKVALVHDYLKEYGGAERVLWNLHEMFPEAPIYTAFLRKNSAAGKAFWGCDIRETKFAPVLKYKNLYSPLRFLAPLIWSSLDLSAYDLVITSASWYITRGFKVGPKTKVVCYCHTPPRYLYGYETSIEWQRYWPVKIYAAITNHFLRLYDYRSAQKVDWFVANSANVRARIKKFYRRDAEIVYPPVEVDKIINATKGLKPKDYYLIASRIVGAKGIELAMAAAKKAKFKLKIIGEPAGLKWQAKDLDRLKNPYVSFLGRVSDEQLYRAYGECKAFLALAKQEDFGMTPVEAMAAGRPVIAYKGGGYLETVIDGKTGIFFEEATVGGLVKAIKQFEVVSSKAKREDCVSRAKEFSKDRFRGRMMKLINSFLKEG